MIAYNPPQNCYPCIVYADDRLCVASKPEGLLSVPGKAEHHKDCLETRIQQHFHSAKIVHRLDMATSGLLIFALDADAHRNLGLQFERRKVAKRYIAKVWGHVRDESGLIDLPLRCDWPNRPKQMVDHAQGKAAKTHWRRLGHETTPCGAPSTRLELTPITGRSHQLRVHTLSLGHPILGDQLYAHDAALKAAPRLKLHAEQISFHHPNDGRIITLSDPCPF